MLPSSKPIALRTTARYVLALKGNQSTMLADVASLFADARATTHQTYAMQQASDVSTGHGRVETRRAFVVSDLDVIAYLNDRGRWADLRSVALVEAERTLNGTTSTEQRFYLLNQVVEAATLNTLVRAHWGIENQVHWVLDVVFHEDASRIRTVNAPQNMGVVRHIALNLLRQEPGKGSIKTERFRAALNQTYLAKVLGI